MELEHDVILGFRRLPPDQQREALDFVEFLEKKAAVHEARVSLCGIYADLGIHLSAEEIDEARREAWGGFARDDD